MSHMSENRLGALLLLQENPFIKEEWEKNQSSFILNVDENNTVRQLNETTLVLLNVLAETESYVSLEILQRSYRKAKGTDWRSCSSPELMNRQFSQLWKIIDSYTNGVLQPANPLTWEAVKAERVAQMQNLEYLELRKVQKPKDEDKQHESVLKRTLDKEAFNGTIRAWEAIDKAESFTAELLNILCDPLSSGQDLKDKIRKKAVDTTILINFVHFWEENQNDSPIKTIQKTLTDLHELRFRGPKPVLWNDHKEIDRAKIREVKHYERQKEYAERFKRLNSTN